MSWHIVISWHKITWHMTNLAMLWQPYSLLVSFPGLPTVQFLIACSMQKRKGKAWSILSREWRFVYLGRQRGGGVPIERTHFTHTFFVSKQQFMQTIFKHTRIISDPQVFFLGMVAHVRTVDTTAIFQSCKRPGHTANILPEVQSICMTDYHTHLI